MVIVRRLTVDRAGKQHVLPDDRHTAEGGARGIDPGCARKGHGHGIIVISQRPADAVTGEIQPAGMRVTVIGAIDIRPVRGDKLVEGVADVPAVTVVRGLIKRIEQPERIRVKHQRHVRLMAGIHLVTGIDIEPSVGLKHPAGARLEGDIGIHAVKRGPAQLVHILIVAHREQHKGAVVVFGVLLPVDRVVRVPAEQEAAEQRQREIQRFAAQQLARRGIPLGKQTVELVLPVDIPRIRQQRAHADVTAVRRFGQIGMHRVRPLDVGIGGNIAVRLAVQQQLVFPVRRQHGRRQAQAAEHQRQRQQTSENRVKSSCHSNTSFQKKYSKPPKKTQGKVDGKTGI